MPADTLVETGHQRENTPKLWVISWHTHLARLVHATLLTTRLHQMFCCLKFQLAQGLYLYKAIAQSYT